MLSDALPKIFHRRRIKYETSSQLVEAFDNWLHAFFLQHCGPLAEVPTTQQPAVPTSKRHRGLERLRQQKNNCKKAFKAIEKAGLCSSTAGQKLKDMVHAYSQTQQTSMQGRQAEVKMAEGASRAVVQA